MKILCTMWCAAMFIVCIIIFFISDNTWPDIIKISISAIVFAICGALMASEVK